MRNRDHVIITGNIGTGKTTLVQHLRELIPGSLVLEERQGMYLEDLYRDPAAYAFRSQLDFTLHLLDLALATSSADRLVIQERCIFDAHDVFSKTLFEAGYIQPRDFELLGRVHRMTAARSNPTFLIFLDATPTTSLERVRSRGDPDEARVTLDYLQSLHRAYGHWYGAFDRCRKVIVDTDATPPSEVAVRAIDAIMSLRAA